MHSNDWTNARLCGTVGWFSSLSGTVLKKTLHFKKVLNVESWKRERCNRNQNSVLQIVLESPGPASPWKRCRYLPTSVTVTETKHSHLLSVLMANCRGVRKSQIVTSDKLWLHVACIQAQRWKCPSLCMMWPSRNTSYFPFGQKANLKTA